LEDVTMSETLANDLADAGGEPTPMQQVMDPAHRANPYPLYDRLRERPVWLEADGAYVVARYDDVSSLIRDPRMSAEARAGRNGPGLSFLNMDPPQHDRLRRMTNRHFGPPVEPGRVEGMTPALEATVKDLIDGFGGRTEIDVVDGLAYPLPVTVIADLLGVPRQDEPKFHAWAEAIVQAQDRDENTPPGQRTAGAEKAFQELAGYMFGLISARKGAPRDDMLSRLVNDDGPDGAMAPGDMIAVSVLLLLAGHETTVNLITNGMLTLLRFPHLLERLRAQPQIAPALVEEMLRYEPPVHFTFRTTLCDVKVAGETIPEGSGVRLMLASANRDPRRFDHADVFDPDRTNNQHLGFGSGIHACFGAPLARLEGQIALRELSRRLVNPRLAQDPPPYRFNPSLRGPRHLPVRIDGVIGLGLRSAAAAATLRRLALGSLPNADA
jgi:cytochrome P450